MTYEFTNFKMVKWKIGSVFVLTGGNVLYASEMQTHLSLLKKMEGLSKYQLPCKAPSTRIRIFSNPQLFRSGFKNFSVHT